jgi:hypothetical protein
MSKYNMYRGNYLVMEGGNYAGGWGKRHADIFDLGDVAKYSHVESVVPIFIEFGEPLDDATIQKAVDELCEKKRQQRKIDDVQRAERQLQSAKAALDL